jgi:hypothetical protein
VLGALAVLTLDVNVAGDAHDPVEEAAVVMGLAAGLHPDVVTVRAAQTILDRPAFAADVRVVRMVRRDPLDVLRVEELVGIASDERGRGPPEQPGRVPGREEVIAVGRVHRDEIGCVLGNQIPDRLLRDIHR